MFNPNFSNPEIVTRMAELREEELRREAYALGDSAYSFSMPRRAPRERAQKGAFPALLAWAYGLLGR